MENKIPKCIAPWVYLDILPEGTVVPCCSNSTELGNVKFQTLEEIWNGDKMKQLRLDMFKDQLPESCQFCNSNNSLKDVYNQKFKSSFSEVDSITLDDGSVKEVKIKGFDFRISNKCNFKCRTCWSKLSSSINFENRSNNLGNYYEEPILNVNNYFDFKKMYQDNIDNLELIEFSGGEVLLMDEHYEMLDYFITNNKQSQIELNYNTNFSTIDYNNKSIIKLWSQWDPSKLVVSISIDEIGTRSEYVRYGTVWNKLSNNIKQLIDSYEIKQNRFRVNANIVVSVFNVNRIPEILSYLLDINFITGEYNYDNFTLSMEGGMRDGIYDIELYPIEKRKEIKQKILNFMDQFPIDLGDKFSTLLQKLDNLDPPNINKIKEFLEDTKKIDKIRNQNLLEVIPELQCLVDYVS